MASLANHNEGLRSYKTVQEFFAYESEGLAPAYIPQDVIVIADPDYWTGWKWNGRESLPFYWERKQYYIDRKTFLSVVQSMA